MFLRAPRAQCVPNPPTARIRLTMKLQMLLLLVGVAAFAAARPSDIIDFETDTIDHEQEGQAGKAVNGEYSWVAPNGEEFSVKYVADHLGYRVLESNAQPKFRAAEEVVVEEKGGDEGAEEEGAEEEGAEEEGAEEEGAEEQGAEEEGGEEEEESEGEKEE